METHVPTEDDYIDNNGLKLLHVKMMYPWTLGLQAEPINLSNGMLQTIQRLGPANCFTDNYPDVA